MNPSIKLNCTQSGFGNLAWQDLSCFRNMRSRIAVLDIALAESSRKVIHAVMGSLLAACAALLLSLQKLSKCIPCADGPH